MFTNPYIYPKTALAWVIDGLYRCNALTGRGVPVKLQFPVYFTGGKLAHDEMDVCLKTGLKEAATRITF